MVGLRRSWRRVAPYAGALGITAAAAAVIAGLSRFSDPPGWLLVFVLAALGIGIWFGTGPTVLAAVAMALCYDYFFEGPTRSLTIAYWPDGVYMVFLLGSGILGGRVGALMSQARADAAASAGEVATVYEVATEALRARDRDAALDHLCQRALGVRCIEAFSIVVPDPDSTRVFGRPLAEARIQEALSAHRRGTPVGVRAGREGFHVVQMASGPGRPALLPVGGGIAVFEVARNTATSAAELRALGAITALAAIILDRPAAQAPADLRILDIPGAPGPEPPRGA